MYCTLALVAESIWHRGEARQDTSRIQIQGLTQLACITSGPWCEAKVRRQTCDSMGHALP